jgi:PadR family transcriptional regulator, regulatory protein PadR
LTARRISEKVDIAMSRKTRVLSVPAAVVLQWFLNAPEDELHGFRIIKDAGIPPSTLYPVLRVLAEERKLLTWRWEEIDPRAEKRPARRLYRLNGNAAEAAHAAVAEAERHHAKRASASWRIPAGESA